MNIWTKLLSFLGGNISSKKSTGWNFRQCNSLWECENIPNIRSIVSIVLLLFSCKGKYYRFKVGITESFLMFYGQFICARERCPRLRPAKFQTNRTPCPRHKVLHLGAQWKYTVIYQNIENCMVNLLPRAPLRLLKGMLFMHCSNSIYCLRSFEQTQDWGTVTYYTIRKTIRYEFNFKWFCRQWFSTYP